MNPSSDADVEIVELFVRLLYRAQSAMNCEVINKQRSLGNDILYTYFYTSCIFSLNA